MSDHTPGPWEWSGDCLDGPRCATVLEPCVNRSTWCEGCQESLDVSDADRALIAAAPELLEALEAVEWSGPGFRCPRCNGMSPTDGHSGHYEDCKLAAALRKARGITQEAARAAEETTWD